MQGIWYVALKKVISHRLKTAGYSKSLLNQEAHPSTKIGSRSSQDLPKLASLFCLWSLPRNSPRYSPETQALPSDL